ncbi:metal-dependent protease [Erythrobacter sp. NAP1]|uniref:tRNA (adenosine(37)-N6)-threonylcarbamoyltransferase complex dimerization subunit type 1 TsaB n=1 Tax=Erythrobacter sp. NAP1 TaxID=237727 RepID=UPI0000686A4E|nr:tRNA (adenosine(37)-N6)-threonylcarbamoyltransferase complex dimerization subunit type 1 TsaB [Erythrobacter sp. NAP1]EAQ30651.1 metal-dependent protease [Erythrobacter sp. NAP1]
MQDPSRTLAIETASEACSIALFAGDELIARDHRVLGRGHAERLVPMIEAMPDRGRASRILVSLGPGSFTGVRIGIAAARALGFAWGADVHGYPTLALVAARAMQDAPGPVTVCMNGGHGEWFIADFSRDSKAEVRSLTPEQAAERGAHRTIAGNRAQDFAALLEGDHEAVELLPDAGNVKLLPYNWLTSDLTPIYGRAPDAKPQKQAAT